MHLKRTLYTFCLVALISFIAGCQHIGGENISAEQLKNMIETNTPMVILDARNPAWDDGHRIPGAKFVPHHTPIAEIERIVPSKEALVVVYCGSYSCPASKKLGQTLIENGYKHVLEYSGGIKEWEEDKHFPITLTQRGK